MRLGALLELRLLALESGRALLEVGARGAERCFQTLRELGLEVGRLLLGLFRLGLAGLVLLGLLLVLVPGSLGRGVGDEEILVRERVLGPVRERGRRGPPRRAWFSSSHRSLLGAPRDSRRA